MQIPKTVIGDFINELDRLPDILAKYKSLEQPSLSDCEPDLMLSFSKWCSINDFIVLRDVYDHYFTSYGLGDVDAVPALYVLRVLNYDNLMSFMELPEFCTWKEGVSSLVAVLSEGIRDIRMEQKIIEIQSTEDGKCKLFTEVKTFEYDYVIIAAPLTQFSSLYQHDPEMQGFLKEIQYQNYNVYAFLAGKTQVGCGCVLENLAADRRGHVVLWSTRWDTDADESMVIVYAYNHPSHSKEDGLRMVENDLIQLGISNPKLYQVKRWQQCPFVKTEVLQNGFYKKLEESQGKNNVYLASEIMSTISLENCIQYATYLVNRYF